MGMSKTAFMDELESQREREEEQEILEKHYGLENLKGFTKDKKTSTRKDQKKKK